MNVLSKAIVFGALLFAIPAFAAGDYPNAPIKLIVPFPPSGAVDLTARVIAPKLGEILGETVVVENRPGGDTIVGTDLVAKARPDGYTLLLAPSSFTVNPAFRDTMPYDPVADFKAISQVTAINYVFSVRSEDSVVDIASLVEKAKAKPGTVSVGFSGTGHQLAVQLLEQMAGVKFNQVRYKGASNALLDLLGGRIDLLLSSISAVQSQIGEGKVRPIATTGARRSTILTDVKTVSEQGYGDFNVIGWNGILVPSETPSAVVERLSAAVEATVSDPAVAELIAKSGSEPVTDVGAAELGKFIAKDIARWKSVIAVSGVPKEE